MSENQKLATKVLIVDDHPVVVSGCKSLFASDSSVRIEGAGNAKTGYLAFLENKPDVTVIDIKLPDVSGFELMRQIRKEDPDARIIMFSMNDDPVFALKSKRRVVPSVERHERMEAAARLRADVARP